MFSRLHNIWLKIIDMTDCVERDKDKDLGGEDTVDLSNQFLMFIREILQTIVYVILSLIKDIFQLECFKVFNTVNLLIYLECDWLKDF